MDGRELREAILREQSRSGTPYEVEVYYDGCVRCTSGADGPSLQRTTNCIKGSSCSSTTIVVRRSSTCRSTTAHSARGSMKLKFTSSRCLLDVIFCLALS
jgi:hypothetical protein